MDSKRLESYSDQYTQNYEDCIANYYGKYYKHRIVFYNLKDEKCVCDVCKEFQLNIFCLKKYATQGIEIIHGDKTADINLEAVMDKTRSWVKKRVTYLASFLLHNDDEDAERCYKNYLDFSTNVPANLYMEDDLMTTWLTT